MVAAIWPVRAALANARAAYRRFQEIFSGGRWDGLRHGGAAVQRPLWASTGTKNPHYPDTMYVDGLVGPHTVNTMPLPTLLAFADHGAVSGSDRGAGPVGAIWTRWPRPGSDLEQVTDELLVDGVKQFEEAMNRLLAGIEERRAAVVTGQPSRIQARLPMLAPGAGRGAGAPGGVRERGAAGVAARRDAVGRGRDA